jgi:hypothetical protein
MFVNHFLYTYYNSGLLLRSFRIILIDSEKASSNFLLLFHFLFIFLSDYSHRLYFLRTEN